MGKGLKKRRWDPYLPLSMLPENIKEHFVQHAKILYEELKYNKLEVILIPAPYPYTDRNKIRAVENRPPIWFSEMYHELKRSRRYTLKALERIVNRTDQKTKNTNYMGKYKMHARVRDLIFTHLTQGCEVTICGEDGGYIKPIKKVINYFKA